MNLKLTLKVAAGFDKADVQFIFTSSPTWYFALLPLIRGPSVGNK